MPVLEFAQKLMELYGQERKHLLARESFNFYCRVTFNEHLFINTRYT